MQISSRCCAEAPSIAKSCPWEINSIRQRRIHVNKLHICLVVVVAVVVVAAVVFATVVVVVVVFGLESLDSRYLSQRCEDMVAAQLF